MTSRVTSGGGAVACDVSRWEEPEVTSLWARRFPDAGTNHNFVYQSTIENINELLIYRVSVLCVLNMGSLRKDFGDKTILFFLYIIPAFMAFFYKTNIIKF